MDEVLRGGLWCHEVLGLLDRYVDASLTQQELAAVTEHVGGCDVCARFGGAYARTVAALRAGSVEHLGDHRAQRLVERLPVYPRDLLERPDYFEPRVREAALRLADASGYARPPKAGARVEAA